MMQQILQVLNKKSITFIILILAQVFLVLLNDLYFYISLNITQTTPHKAITIFALALGICIGISAIYQFLKIVQLLRKEEEYEINKAHLEENKDLIDVLRSNRHDYLNHLQVIMGFMQLKKNDLAVVYIKEITGKLKDQSAIGNVKNLSLAALLLKKQSTADERGVRFAVDIKTDLDQLQIPPSDIARILGNLLDNALTAVIRDNAHATGVSVTVERIKQNTVYKITVSNHRPVIPYHLQHSLFDKGFTTKGALGSGLGLYIVKELTEKHGGHIELVSNKETGTVFSVYLPITDINKNTSNLC